jgi:hypothetical protein
MNAVFGSLATVLLAPALLSIPSASVDAPRKCARAIGDPVYVLDGRIVEAPGRPADVAAIKSIAVICSDESHRVFDIQPGRDLVLTWSNVAPPLNLKTTVEPIVPLQAAYRSANGSFARKLADLPWNDPSGAISVRLCVSEDGQRWVALGWDNSQNTNLQRVLVSSATTGSVAATPQYTCELTPSLPS